MGYHVLLRGHRQRKGSLLSYVLIEKRIPASHPLRRIGKLADQDLDRLNPTFCELYAAEGRPSVDPFSARRANLLLLIETVLKLCIIGLMASGVKTLAPYLSPALNQIPAIKAGEG